MKSRSKALEQASGTMYINASSEGPKIMAQRGLAV